MSISWNLQNALVSYLSKNFFYSDLDIAETVVEYYGGIRPNYYLIKNVQDKVYTKETRKLIEYFLNVARSFPSLVHRDPKNMFDLRQICLFVQYEPDPDVFDHFPQFASFSWARSSSVCTVSCIVLNSLKFICPVNDLDPISMDELALDDLFISLSGERFSLSNLIYSHNTRPYRGTKGEQYGQKFILNPRTNDFFSFTDAEHLIAKAASKTQERYQLIHLHQHRTEAPGVTIGTSASLYQSLHEVYIKHREIQDRMGS